MRSGRKLVHCLLVVGARPNFMKAAPILRAMRERGGFRAVLVHTGQHYDQHMSDVFFRQLRLPRPHVNLGVRGGTHARQTAEVMRRFEPVLYQRRPDVTIVVGDVNSTVACALTSVKLGIPVAHVEAGLRSGDKSMPEEINRIVTDAISDILFTTEPVAAENLLREGRPADAIHFVGNTMIDTLLHFSRASEESGILERLGLDGGARGPAPYAVLTLHRPSNVDDRRTLRNLLRALAVVAQRIPIMFPVHPRTAARIKTFGCGHLLTPLSKGRKAGPAGIFAVQPLGYVDFLRLMACARFMLTDSGGIQEETTILGVPCLTLRENTERPITLKMGTNCLVGREPEVVIRESLRVLTGRRRNPKRPPLWDGRAAQRIAEVLFRKSHPRGQV